MSDIQDAIPEAARAMIDSGRKAALATVVQTWGSAPRPVGAQLAIAEDMEFLGSVSGGCVESAVITEALDAMSDGKCRILSFGVSDESAFEVGLACGGEIKVMVEPVDVGAGPTLAELDRLIQARAAREAVYYEVDTESWTRKIVPAVGDAARRDKSGMEDAVFRGVHNPPLRLVIVGAVHIAQPLVQMARLTGYDVVLCDPRAGFAADSRFPGETFLDDWPDEALAAYGLDARTAVVTLSHDPKIDTPALEVALRSAAFYVGSLGSTRTHAKRIAQLQGLGFADAEIARIHGPIGADIGAATPAEIAVAILAQITERLRRPQTRPNGSEVAAA